MVKNITTIALSIVASLIVGCGGSSSSSNNSSGATDTPTTETKTITGQFIDSEVEGLNYSCGIMSGTTNSNGNFTCKVDETVTFKLGEYTIGSAIAAKTITPATLHPTDTQALENTLRLLQTLDSDGNPSNGITLNKELIKLLKADSLAINSKDFEGMASVLGGKVMVSAEDAKAHFESKDKIETLTKQLSNKHINFASDSGDFFFKADGTFTHDTADGTDKNIPGTWSIDDKNQLVMYLNNEFLGTFKFNSSILAVGTGFTVIKGIKENGPETGETGTLTTFEMINTTAKASISV